LVIDELNRANIDKAIGQLFTVLSGRPWCFRSSRERTRRECPSQSLPAACLPPVGTAARYIAPNWRILATMNDRDRDLLFDMSEALMRRFAIVEVGPSDRETWLRPAADKTHGPSQLGRWHRAAHRLRGLAD
jgi:hypothetical protein